MNRPLSATTNEDFGDSYIDISRTERRLIRVTNKTYPNTGTYLFRKLFRKGIDDEYYLDQRLTLTASEFYYLINNKDIIGMQPGPKKGCNANYQARKAI